LQTTKSGRVKPISALIVNPFESVRALSGFWKHKTFDRIYQNTSEQVEFIETSS